MYEVTAYSKDDDIYDVLFVTDNVEEAMLVAEPINKLIREDRVYAANQEPYDWLEIYKVDGDMCELVKQYE